MGQSITLEINGTSYTSEVEPRLLLVQYLRETLNMTGTHVGCDTSNCGACTIILNGNAVKSCTVFAVQANSGKVTTIEDLQPTTNCMPFRKASGRSTGFSAASARRA